MEAEFAVERASHQKMLGDFARLEQRFTNLQEEKLIERSPDKRQISDLAESGKDFDQLKNKFLKLFYIFCFYYFSKEICSQHLVFALCSQN